MLILPPFAFANCTDNFSGSTPTNSNSGTAVTAAAGANADGTAASLIAAVPHDIHYLVVGIGCVTAQSTTDTAALIDILVDPAGGTTWEACIDDLVCGFQAAMAATLGYNHFYHFPIWIPSGTSLGAQVRCATGSVSFRVGVWAYGNPSRPDLWWCGSKVESLGITAASSKGTDITPGSSTATFSWTNVGATTSGRYGAIQFAQNGSDNNSTAIGYHAQIGVGSARVPGTPTFVWYNGTTEASVRHGHRGPIWCDIPEGTQLQVGACASGTAEVHDVALYGVY
jgi:hypothetical protein